MNQPKARLPPNQRRATSTGRQMRRSSRGCSIAVVPDLGTRSNAAQTFTSAIFCTTQVASRTVSVGSGFPYSCPGDWRTKRPTLLPRMQYRSIIWPSRCVLPSRLPTFAPLRPKRNNAVVRAIEQAFRWREMLESGEYATIREIVASEKINEVLRQARAAAHAAVAGACRGDPQRAAAGGVAVG